MGKNTQRNIIVFSLWVFLIILFAPLLSLYYFNGESSDLDPDLFWLAQWNTFKLALGTLFFTSVVGGCFAYLNCFYSYPLKKWIHALLLMPLAFPAYVLAFIYLGLLGPSSDWSSAVEVQGELWFLVFVLSLALTPYVYYFCCLGLRSVTQSEVETESLMSGGVTQFFRYNTWPKMLPFLISSQILVLFEALSDFGAASVVNVPVITTMIYKLWFDLFSFAGAVQLSLKYSLFILILLIVEVLYKSSTERRQSTHRDPVLGKEIRPVTQFLILIAMGSFIGISFLWPTLQILIWAVKGSQATLWWGTAISTGKTVGLGFVVGVLVVTFSIVLHLVLRQARSNPRLWTVFSTIGYSIPGSLLAVAVYSLLLKMTDEISTTFLLTGLVLALSYKFLTVAMRPISEAAYCLPEELMETSDILRASRWRRWRVFYFPYLKESCIVGALLVMIEVMKEMPLTLMLAPSEFQTLSIKIFNFTSEGEWEKAALPSLMLLAVGVTSVSLINLRRTR